VTLYFVLAALFPMVHLTENHETIQLQLQQGQLLDVNALGSDFVLHQGTQNVYLPSHCFDCNYEGVNYCQTQLVSE
jgi:hypothetical protein